jgi:transposase
MNTKLHAVTDANGRPLSFFITAGQISDFTGAATLLDDLPKAQWMPADRGYDAEWFRDALEQKGQALYSRPQIPLHVRQTRQAPQPYRDHVRRPEGLASRRHTIRSLPPVYFSALALAATVLFWL